MRVVKDANKTYENHKPSKIHESYYQLHLVFTAWNCLCFYPPKGKETECWFFCRSPLGKWNEYICFCIMSISCVVDLPGELRWSCLFCIMSVRCTSHQCIVLCVYLIILSNIISKATFGVIKRNIEKNLFESLVRSFLVAEHIEAYCALIEILEQNLWM